MKKRVLILLLATLVLFSMILCAMEPQHKCIGDECPICCFMTFFRSVFQGLAATAFLCVPGLAIAALGVLRGACLCLEPPATPVLLKVKLTD